MMPDQRFAPVPHGEDEFRADMKRVLELLAQIATALEKIAKKK